MMRAFTFALAILLAACDAPQRESPPGSVALQRALGGSGGGYARAIAPREFLFPGDHAPHDGFRNEWWHVVGTVQTESGRQFGFQTTFFRIAMSPPRAQNARAQKSKWAASHVWMAHAAVTDAKRKLHFRDERFAREALGLAGGASHPPAVWVGGWRLQSRAQKFPGALHVAAEDFALTLTFAPQRAPALQGERGLSKKSASPGAASYYYSVTRMQVSGEIIVDGGAHAVSGLAWLDREWSSGALAERQTGWDWLALHLDDGADFMFYRLRRDDGGVDAHSAGSMVTDSAQLSLGARDVVWTPLQTWRGKHGARYPLRWQLQIAPLGKVWEVRAVADAQEMLLSVHYWEGMVEVFDAGALIGRGYLEMTGYE